MLFFTFYSRILNKKIYHVFHKNIKQPFSNLLIIIRKVSVAANQHIQRISEGSGDTEDWSNNAKNLALP